MPLLTLVFGTMNLCTPYPLHGIMFHRNRIGVGTNGFWNDIEPGNDSVQLRLPDSNDSIRLNPRDFYGLLLSLAASYQE